MQYLSLALYAEGPTDYRFLSPVLQRLCQDICLKQARTQVDIPDVLGLDHPPEEKDAPREARILAAALQAKGAWRVLFIHADGERDPVSQKANLVEPGVHAVRKRFAEGADQLDVVGVVPVRETEAWILAHGDTIRQVFGTRLTDEKLGLPASARVEKDPDPKATLRQCFERAKPRSRQRETAYFQQLGEIIDLDALRRLPSFKQLETELVEVLMRLKIIG